jgi:hypothetical protein
MYGRALVALAIMRWLTYDRGACLVLLWHSAVVGVRARLLVEAGRCSLLIILKMLSGFLRLSY